MFYIQFCKWGKIWNCCLQNCLGFFQAFAWEMKWNKGSGRRGVKGCACRNVCADSDQWAILWSYVYSHRGFKKKQINNEAVVTMPKQRWLMKNMVELQPAMLYECSFIQHPRNKYASDGERTLPWNVVGVRQNLIRPHASKISSSHPRIKFKSSWARSMQAAPLLHYAWFWHLVTWAAF